MTPQEKGDELIERFMDDPFTSQITTKGAVQCAIICAEEILKLGLRPYLPDGGVDSPRGVGYYENPMLKFYKEVLAYLKSKQ